MAFAFGKTTPAFGATAPAPATAPVFGAPAAPAATTAFGAASPAPAFGAAPALPAFGSPKPPASSGGIFGSAASVPAPAAGGMFGGAAPAPVGGVFGSTPTQAGGLYGNRAPAPAPTGSYFGSTPGFASAAAPTNLFSASTAVSPGAPLYGNPQAGATAPVSVNSQTPYASLHPGYKQAIDGIHDKIWNHKRAMAQVSTMAPVLLRPPQEEADAAGGDTSSLSYQLKMLQQQAAQLQINLRACANDSMILKQTYEASTTQSIVHGIWPMEALAARKGVKLSSSSSQQKQQTTTTHQQQGLQSQQQQGTNSTQTMTITEQIRRSLELQATHVDRLEKTPSPYMWKTLEDMETRLDQLKNKIEAINLELQQRTKIGSLGLASVVQSQTDQLLRASTSIGRLQHQAEALRKSYSSWERQPTNVLTQQRIKDMEGQQKQEERIKIAYLKVAAKSQPAMLPLAVAAPAPAFGTQAPGGLFGSKPATGGFFGSAPAPASGGGGGVFGAPAGGGVFGNASAPATGGMFGKSPAPAGGGIFGSTPAPAAPSGGLFGNTPAAPAFGATPAAPSGGGIFGSAATAPAPPSGGMFGSAPAAPAFGATAAAPAPSIFGSTSSSSSKSKNKSRGSRRK